MAARKKAEGDGEAKKDAVRIFAPDIKAVQVTVTCTTSILLHAFSKTQQKKIRDKQAGKGDAQRKRRDEEQDLKDCFYEDDPVTKGKGQWLFPASAFKKAMVDACTQLNNKKIPKTLVRGALFVTGKDHPDYVGIVGTVKMNISPVRLPTKVADIRIRPEVSDWSAQMIVELDVNVLTIQEMLNLLARAGFSVGVGDWRPQCNGNHGRFEVQGSE